MTTIVPLLNGVSIYLRALFYLMKLRLEINKLQVIKIFSVNHLSIYLVSL